MNVRTGLHSPFKKFGSRSHGFTVIEIIAVLVILGIMTALAVSRFTDIRAADVAAANSLKAHLRYAQLRAMGDLVPWGIRLEGNSYTLLRDGAPAPVNLPGENSRTKGNVSVGTGTVMFEPAFGRPDPDGVTIFLGGSSVVVAAGTGFMK